MSVTISFTQVTPEQLDKAAADPDWAWDLLGELATTPPDGSLDKTWPGVEFLLERCDIYLDLLMDGVSIDDDGNLFAWDVDQVARTAGTLAATTWDQLAAHFDPAAMSAEKIYPSLHLWDHDDLDYLKFGYETLTTFFTTTAKAHAAALMCFTF
ncbi:MAG TPA: DUF1877 family protein [Actinocatenispora sp.]